MYHYDALDQQLVNERVAQYRDQLTRYLNGQLDEDAFRPLRLQNGLYIQRHAPMLRVAIPYGLINAPQLRALADIAEKYDRGFGHFTTRQNIQFNWLKLEDTADVLAALAKVQMHAIQTSGNCVRNISCDAFAGAAHDEIADPRPLAELLRQFSSFHPEFSLLPRKFKIAIAGSPSDRAAIALHDIGLQMVRNAAGELGVKVLAGGGLGRTPVIGQVVRDFVSIADSANYVESILRVYNLYGRRDNLYKARIKILLKALGLAAFQAEVEAEFAQLKNSEQGKANTISAKAYARVASQFPESALLTCAAPLDTQSLSAAQQTAFALWQARCVRPHKQAGRASVSISFKRLGIAAGDINAAELRQLADLALQFNDGVAVVTHTQNVVLANVARVDLIALWQGLRAANLARANIGLATDITACPGLDYCSLANAPSIPVALAIDELIDAADYQHDVGEIAVKISGCINACAHHHIADIGLLGVDKDGAAFYQITLGGHNGTNGTPAIGKIIGHAVPQAQAPQAVNAILQAYLSLRDSDAERFGDTLARLGLAPFKAAVYNDEASATTETTETTTETAQ